MKPSHRLPLTAFAVAALTIQLLPAGNLEPPGPPAPTMATLQDIADRIPPTSIAPPTLITELPANITQSGVYALDSDLILTQPSNAITIAAPNVIVDLMDHSVTMAAGAYFVSAQAESVTIRNGRFIVPDTEESGGGMGLQAREIELANLTVYGSREPINVVPSPSGYATIERLEIYNQWTQPGLRVSCDQCIIRLEDSLLRGGDDNVILSGIRASRIVGNQFVTYAASAALSISGDDNLIAENIMTPAYGHDVGLTMSGNGNLVRDNVIRGYHTFLIEIVSGEGNVFQNNHLTSSAYYGISAWAGVNYVLKDNTILGTRLGPVCGEAFTDAGGNVCDFTPGTQECTVQPTCD